MLYQFLSNIPRQVIFNYLMIIVIVTLVINRIWYLLDTSSISLIGFIVAVIVIIYLQQRTEALNSNFVYYLDNVLSSELMQSHINTNLYRDSELVRFLDNHREYYQYNPQLYQKIVSEINHFLKLQNEFILFEKASPGDMEALSILKTQIQNSFHNFIYRLPHTQNSIVKFQEGMKWLTDSLNKHLDNTHILNNRRSRDQGIYTGTDFTYRGKNHPKVFSFEDNDKHQFW
jgi:hypothetical protein